LEALRGLLEDLVDASGSALSVLLTLLKKTQNETSSGKKGIQNSDTDFHQSLLNPINVVACIDMRKVVLAFATLCNSLS
jgi:hypothetical protein